MIDLEKDLEKIWAFDVEVFPNFFCVTFINASNRSIRKVFEVSIWKDDRKAVLEFVSQGDKVLKGYNSESYDNLIINFFTRESCRIPVKIFLKALFKVSSAIVNEEYTDEIKKLRFAQRAYRYIDMFKIKPSSFNRISLKQIAINLNWNRIQDLPYPFAQALSREQADRVIAYNSNDVEITLKLFDKLRPKLDLRVTVSKNYGVDVVNETESGMANVILTERYAQVSGLAKEDFYKERSSRPTVNFDDCIASNISFRSQTLQKFLKRLRKTVVYKYADFKFETKIRVGNVTYQMGVGGLHSEDFPAKYQTDSDYIIRDADVTSFYPYIVLNNRFKPAHLTDAFFEVYQAILNDRVVAKTLMKKASKSGDNATFVAENNVQESLKITANSVFGKFNSEFFWLYDPKCMVQTTVNGQLYLLMLIERLEQAGIEVISANTDGVVAKIRRSDEDLYYQICREWEADTSFSLEYADYKLYLRRDVNNYVSVKENGAKLEIKKKGAFDDDINLFKGYKSPVVPRAVLKFLIDEVPIEETIRSCDSIYDFCRSQKVGKQFDCYSLEIVDRKVVKNWLQKNNRFYASTRGGSFIKRNRENGSETRLMAGKRVSVLNDVDPSIPMGSYSIDYEFYIDEAWKIIEGIVPRKEQLNLFDFAC